MQAIGVHLVSTRNPSRLELEEVNNLLGIPNQAVLPQKTESLSSILRAAVSAVGPASWTVMGGWEVTIEVRQVNHDNKRRTTLGVFRVSTPRDPHLNMTYNDSVGKIVLFHPVRKTTEAGRIVDKSSARIQMWTNQKDFEGISPEEWDLIQIYMSNIAAEYTKRLGGELSGAALRHYYLKALPYIGIVAGGEGLPRIAPIEYADRIEKAKQAYKEIGIEIDTYGLTNADSIIRKSIEGPLQTAEKRVYDALSINNPKPVFADQWLHLAKLHDAFDRAINQTTPRPFLDQREATARGLLTQPE